MKKIVLLSCASKKKPYSTKAKDLYDSSLFYYSLIYAEKIKPDKIYILSAKYGVVDIDEEVEPYDQTLNEMKTKERKMWSGRVLKELQGKGIDLERDKIIILAGKNYRQYILENIQNYEIPLEGLSIGQQLCYLKERTSANGSLF